MPGRRKSPRAVPLRSVRALMKPATLRARTSRSSTTGWRGNSSVSRRLWPTSSAVAWPLSRRPRATMLPKRPKLRPRRSQSSSVSATTRSSWVLSPVLRGQTETRRGSIFFFQEVVRKRLGLLHELVPKAVRIAVLINPANAPVAETMLREVPEAARAIGLQIQVLNASTRREIELAFATIVRDRAEAVFVAPDSFFASRRVQFVTLATRFGIPSSYTSRADVEAGGLMSYGADIPDMFRRVGVYTGQILKGAKPADLPVLQSTKLEFVINLQTARALGLEVSPTLLARVDEVIE